MTAETGNVLVPDFDGVISRTLFETHDATERAFGPKPGQLTWKGPFDPQGDPLRLAMREDRISERDYLLTRSTETGELIGQTWASMSDPWIAARGDIPNEVIRPDFLPQVDVVHDATYTSTMKPAPEACRNLMAELDVAADRCVFVDDQRRNVDGAKAVGMAAVHFGVLHPEESFAEAERLSGLHERTGQ